MNRPVPHSFLIAACLAWGLCLGLPALASNEIKSLQVQSVGEHTKVIVTLTQSTDASFFTLSDPERAVIDLKSAQSTAGLMLTPSGVVGKVRLGARPDGGLRIVLDVNERVDLNPITSSGNRIEVDLQPSHVHKAVSVVGNARPDLVLNSSKAPSEANGATVVRESSIGNNAPSPIVSTGDRAHGGDSADANGSIINEVHIRDVAGQTMIEIVLTGQSHPIVSTQDRKLEIDLSPAELGNIPIPAATGMVTGFEVKPNSRGGLKLQFQLAMPLTFRTNFVEDGSAQRHRLMVVLDATAKDESSNASSVMAAATAPNAPALDLSHHHNRPYVVSVDAGHGGEDPGALGHRGTREKDVTLAIAKELAARLNQQAGIHAVLTRDTDVFLPLRERIRRARVAQADLFISIHADAVQNSTATGASVYVLSEHGASSEAAKWLADRENAADLIGGVKLENKDKVLASVLLDLSQSAAMSMSMAAADRVLSQLNTVGELHKTQIQQAGFVVLKSPDIPSMLIESAYITNPGEEERLKDPTYEGKLADAIVTGVKQFFKENATPGARTAKL